MGSPANSTLSFGVGGRAEEAGQHLGCGNQTQGPVMSWRSRGTEQLPQIWSIKGGGKQFGLKKLEGGELSSLPLTVALCCPQLIVGGQELAPPPACAAPIVHHRSAERARTRALSLCSPERKP